MGWGRTDPPSYDAQPDSWRFWSLRALVLLMLLGGLAAFAFGLLHGAVAYYATKNGRETARFVQEATLFLGGCTSGLILMGMSQVCRVVMAIEENTRWIAHHTRPRLRPAEAPRPRPAPPAQGGQASERLRA